MNKKEEIQALRNFIETLPEGTYLRDFFGQSLAEIENIITTDFTYLPAQSLRDFLNVRKGLEESVEALKEEEKDLKGRIKTLENSLDILRQKTDRAYDSLYSITSELAKLKRR